MIAGFEAHGHFTVIGDIGMADLLKDIGFGMGQAKTFVPAFGDDFAAAGKNRTDQGIGTGQSLCAECQFVASSDELFFL